MIRRRLCEMCEKIVAAADTQCPLCGADTVPVGNICPYCDSGFCFNFQTRKVTCKCPVEEKKA